MPLVCRGGANSVEPAIRPSTCALTQGEQRYLVALRHEWYDHLARAGWTEHVSGPKQHDKR